MSSVATAAAPTVADTAYYYDRWWPLAFEATTVKNSPSAVELLGANVVLWYNGEAWCTAVDACPHRLARLSEGRIDERGHVECPYHGWSFDGASGACTSAPQCAPSQALDVERSRLTSLPTETRAGVVWCWTAALRGASTFPDYSQLCDALTLESEVFAHATSIADYARELPMDASMLLENVLDPAHLPFTHHLTISNRKNAGPTELRLVDGGVALKGFTADKSFPGGSTNTTGSAAFRAPALVLSLTDRGRESFRDWNVVYAVPLAPGRCRILVRVCFETAKLKGPQGFIFRHVLPRAPTWALHLSNHKVLEDDNVFLHHAGNELRARAAVAESSDDLLLHPSDLSASTYYMPTAADNAVRAYRAWLERYTARRGTPYAREQSPPPPASSSSRAALLSRTSHTEHCSSCASAKATAGRVSARARDLSMLALAAAAVSAGAPQYAALAISLASYAAHRLAQRLLVEFDDGAYPPPRNLD